MELTIGETLLATALLSGIGLSVLVYERKFAPVHMVAPPGSAGGATRAARITGRLDHVPFDIERVDPVQQKARLKDRFKRSMQKTRDLLNRDVSEVMGAGPLPEAFEDIEAILIQADVGVAEAASLAQELKEGAFNSDTLKSGLKARMKSSLTESDRRLRLNPDGLTVWLIVGVNGSGKTTSIAKLGSLAKQSGLKVLLVAGDTFRAAAIEQLQTWGERVDLEVMAQHTGADAAAVVFDALSHARSNDFDLVIVDTAGRLQNRKPLMDELNKVVRVASRQSGELVESLLVLDATTGSNGVSQAKGFSETAGITGLLLAKMDGTAKGGIAFSVERELGIPIKAVGVGESFEDLTPFDPDSFVDALLD